MTLLAIDPGNTHSAYVVYDGAKPTAFAKLGNQELLDLLITQNTASGDFARVGHVAIEMIASYGMPVGAEVFETCVWIGRYVQALDLPCQLVYRRDVKLHLCGQARAKDGNVRQALINRYGGKEAAIGRKATPGPLYGISADVWQALAVAVTAWETTTARAA